MNKSAFRNATTGIITIMAVTNVTVAQAQEGVSLPGGASSLRETHEDWAVGCTVQAGTAPTKICSLSQEQVDGRTQQRVLAIEVRPSSAGAARVILILPFGLNLQKGITLQIDDAEVSAMKPFRTCLPADCLVDAEMDDATVMALRRGNALKVNTVADGGKEISFAISLKGFQGAFERAVELGNSD